MSKRAEELAAAWLSKHNDREAGIDELVAAFEQYGQEVREAAAVAGMRGYTLARTNARRPSLVAAAIREMPLP